MRSDERDSIDSLIEGALSSYAMREPPLGLEQRVMGRVRAAGERRRFAFPRWVFAAAAVACAVVLAIALRLQRSPVPPPPEAIRAAVPVPPLVSPEPKPPAPARSSRRRTLAAALPKREVFPTPAPLTPGERALLALAVRAPETAREVLADAQQRSVDPIQIDEISIPPLKTDAIP